MAKPESSFACAPMIVVFMNRLKDLRNGISTASRAQALVKLFLKLVGDGA